MARLSRLMIVLLLAAAVCAAQGAMGSRPMPPTSVAPAHAATTPAPKAQATKASKSQSKSKTAKHPPAEEPLPPPRPLTPEQQPATRPTVSYRNGQLSIVANNSTMSEVLTQVKQQTGAQFEMTGVSAADRVYARLGPGSPKDVLAALLAGTRFNFAILGSPTDPAAVARVVLMPRAGGASGATVAANPQPPFRQPPQPQPEDEVLEEEMPVVEEEPPPPSEEPSEQPQQQPGQVKTPEQLLQELQQMQQQQQQNQQQNPPQQPIPDREIPD